MKKGIILLVIGLFLLSIASVDANSRITSCNPSIELLNQDPYPANPGEYVKLVFQIDGLDNPDCGIFSVEVRESFPFFLDASELREYDFLGSTFVRNFKSSALAPYEILVDEDAVDGDNKLEVVMEYTDLGGNIVSEIHDFDINVDGVKVDFEVSIRDYNPGTNTISFEILNVGEDDVVALAVDVPKQDNIAIKGASRNIIGDLDANDDTTFRFEAQPSDGDIDLKITYTDPLNERREMIKKVQYDSSYFTDRKADEVQPVSAYLYLFWGLVLILFVRWIWRRWKGKKKKK